MITLPDLTTSANPTVHYACLYGTLDGYAVQTPAGTTYFCDHDVHVYALDADQAHALTLLSAVAGVERANVLQALARCEETR